MRQRIIEKYYLDFFFEMHTAGCKSAQSYVAALKKLDAVLHQHGVFLASFESVWSIRDVKRLVELYSLVKEEQKKSDGGIFCDESQKNYWKKGFYSEAVKDFSQFLTLADRQYSMIEQFEILKDAHQLAQRLEIIKIKPNPLLIPDDIDINTPEGKSKLKEVQIQQNQHIFRKIIFSIYREQCCLTGLPVREILRASRIRSWASDTKNRMNPENGLCLSATYAAAFECHLISFDEDYRLIFAPSLKDHCTSEAFKEQFQRLHGKRITMPTKFLPSQKLLAEHRKHLVR